MITRNELHDREVAAVANALRRRGHVVERTPRMTGRGRSPAGDLCASGLTVAVVSAIAHPILHRTVIAGHVYRHTYLTLQWNFSIRNKRRRGVDVWVLVWLRAAGRRWHYVLPAAAIKKRVGIQVQPLTRLEAGRHWLSPWREKWEFAAGSPFGVKPSAG